METYLIALKRERRQKAPDDWVEQIRAVPGVRLVGQSQPFMVRIQATPEALEKIHALVGDSCHIEPIILHHPS